MYAKQQSVLGPNYREVRWTKDKLDYFRFDGYESGEEGIDDEALDEGEFDEDDFDDDNFGDNALDEDAFDENDHSRVII